MNTTEKQWTINPDWLELEDKPHFVLACDPLLEPCKCINVGPPPNVESFADKLVDKTRTVKQPTPQP